MLMKNITCVIYYIILTRLKTSVKEDQEQNLENPEDSCLIM